MDKQYDLGIIVGRFQVFHDGHQAMIDEAIYLCNNVGVFIGSSQESGTNKNPFSYKQRKEFLKKIYGSQISIYPLPDIGVGNNNSWGEYVIENVVDRFGKKPNLLISGKEERRVNWFDGIEGLSVLELYVPKTVGISASQMRQFILDNDFESWKKYTHPGLWNDFPFMREVILSTYKNTKTSSI